MKVKFQYIQNRLIVYLGGNIRNGDAEELMHRLNGMVRANTREVIVECSRVVIFSTHVLAKLTLFYKKLVSSNRGMRFTGVSAQFYQLLKIIDMDNLVIRQLS